MVAVDKQFRNMIIVNALLVLFYLFFDWAEYALLNAFSPNSVIIQSHFPFYVQASGAVNGEPTVALSFNFPLLMFLIAIIVNLRYIIRLRKP